MTDDLLVAILERLDRLEAAVNWLSPEPRLSRQDRLVLQRLLPALHAQYASVPFTVREVLESTTLRPFCAGRSSKSLGNLFRRAAGIFIHAVMIEKSGADEGHARL